jgi:DNA-binding XRE family transcriptional regulator
MVMNGDYSGKVPFKPALDANGFICGMCVAYEDFGSDSKQLSNTKGASPALKCPHYDSCSVNACPLESNSFDSLTDDPETQCRLTKANRQKVLNEEPCQVCGKVCNKPVRSVSPLQDLRAWRKGKKLTQKDLGKSLGVSQQTVAKVERGERVMPERWLEIIEKIHPTHAQGIRLTKIHPKEPHKHWGSQRAEIGL